MGIEQICKLILKLFDSSENTPFPQLSRLPLVCAMSERPGLSETRSTVNITKDLNKIGIPSESMPDGSENLTVAFVYAVVREVFRALKKDASVQVGFQPGSLNLKAFGGNGGGPIVVDGMNMSAGQGFGDIN